MDTDVISRLPKSTIEDLSFYIGCVKELMVKIVGVDENCAFVCFYKKFNFPIEKSITKSKNTYIQFRFFD